MPRKKQKDVLKVPTLDEKLQMKLIRKLPERVMIPPEALKASNKEVRKKKKFDAKALKTQKKSLRPHGERSSA